MHDKPTNAGLGRIKERVNSLDPGGDGPIPGVTDHEVLILYSAMAMTELVRGLDRTYDEITKALMEGGFLPEIDACLGDDLNGAAERLHAFALDRGLYEKPEPHWQWWDGSLRDLRQYNEDNDKDWYESDAR